jgi:hypothetical protein
MSAVYIHLSLKADVAFEQAAHLIFMVDPSVKTKISLQ